ncbi:YaiO family outer membrane beta-barrel protein [Marinifilum caeruleilacunae]|uniref:YaiO family outer membrane beta-barrel protein n=1 Tax=Marinifilum caeruleilacunae TaxID=2499076 RepID=A0ABX1WX28_9BACT|nr:YaiO family outer membrane beta-barrel protein [Marinifilum caeruleilacunae]NOU60674.1 YaiO family outer membrane beta-barrel protein [Marinifilum caeruleilacunae]
MAKYLPLTISLCLLLLCSHLLSAQEIDSLQSRPVTLEFRKAQQLAFNGEKEEARKICYKILEEDPNYHDARILIGRTHAWEKSYEKGRKELQLVLENDYDNKDAILAIIDLEKWAGDLSQALFYCDYGQSFYPREEDILLKKIKIQQEKGLEAKSLQTINELLEINPGSEEGIKLFKAYKSAKRKYSLILKHDFEHFEEPYVRRWHVTSVQLQRRNSWGSLTGKVNFGDLVKDGEALWSNEISKQFEIDAYPRVSATNYLYLNYGYSADDLFPEHRAGAEFYQKLPAKFEVSAGARFLRFDGSSGHKNVYIYTGSVGKYYRNYWFSLRGYFTPKDSDVSRSVFLITRRYLRDAKQYIGLELGTGTSPDEARGNVSNFDTYKYDSWKVRLAYQDQLIDKRLTYLLRAGYEKEEYQVDEKRRIVTLSIKLSYQL